MKLLISSALALTASLFLSNVANAAEGGETPEAPKDPPPAVDVAAKRVDVRLTVDTGIFKDDHGGGFLLGGEMLHRRGLLALGLVGEYGTTVFMPYRYWGGGGGAGISLPTPSWMRIDLLGLFGVHRYDGVGSIAVLGLVNDPGVSATLPSVGARLSTTFELGGPMRFVIGVKGLIDRDLGETTKSHLRTILFSPSEEHASTVGGMRLAGLLTVGGTIGD